MKKVLLGSIFVMLAVFCKLNAQGIWASGFTATVNGTTTNYGLLAPSNLGNGATTTSLGSLTSLVLNGGTILTYKNGGQNICGGTLFYIVYPSGNRPASPTFTSISISYANDCSSGTFPSGVAVGKNCGTGDQQWSTISNNANLTYGLPSNGNYTLEIYYQATGSSSSSSDCSQSFYDNNKGNSTNYTITFDYASKALPVKLIDFSATKQGGHNIVQWQTAEEINNKGFEVQNSNDGKIFSDLAFVGTKGSNSSYTYIDNNASSFYRLKQIDEDGSINYSNIIIVNSYKNISVKVYPNPTKNSITVLGNGMVNIFDASGKFMLSQSTKNGIAQIDISTLPKGFYFVAIGKSAIKIIKE